MDYLKIGVEGLGHGHTLLGANDPTAQNLPMRVTAECDTNQAGLESASDK